MKTVSIILPTYNRLERLKQVLSGLERQACPLDNIEVIVVSDGSTDGTNEYLQTVTTALNLVPLIQPNSGPAAARNTGVARARSELVVFLDDDVVPTTRWLIEHLRTHETHPDAVVLGPMLTPATFAMQPWVRWEQAMLMKQYVSMADGAWSPTARQFYTGNTLLPRRYLLEVGGFDEQFRRAEDVELAYRLAQRGVEFVFNPMAVGYHYAERSFASWLETPYAYGRNDIIFVRNKGEDWLLTCLQNEFRGRHLLVRGLAHACADQPLLCAGAVACLKQGAAVTERFGLDRATQYAYSAIFNLRYYQGIAHEAGGWSNFLQRRIGGDEHLQRETVPAHSS